MKKSIATDIISPMNKINENLIYCSLAHLLIDMTGVMLLFSYRDFFSYEQLVLIAFVYYFITFATQPVLGLVADKMNMGIWEIQRSLWVGLGGIIAIMTLNLFSNVTSPGVVSYVTFLVVLFLLGIANSFIHVVGGRKVLHLGAGNAGPPGFFVSFGALGLLFTGLMKPDLASIFWLVWVKNPINP